MRRARESAHGSFTAKLRSWAHTRTHAAGSNVCPRLTLADGALDVAHNEAVLVVQELDAHLGHLRTKA